MTDKIKKVTITKDKDFTLSISIPELIDIKRELIQINRNLENLNKILQNK